MSNGSILANEPPLDDDQSCATPIVLAIHDAWCDFEAWIKRECEKIDVNNLRNPPTTRLVSAMYGDDAGGTDCTALMGYYYEHDEHKSVGSMHRWLSRHGGTASWPNVQSIRPNSSLRIVFTRCGIMFEAHIKDSIELNTGAELTDDSIILATLPAAPMYKKCSYH